MQPLVPLVFHNLPSLYPLHLEEMIFYTCFTHFLTVPNAPSKTMLEYRCKKEMLIGERELVVQLARFFYMFIIYVSGRCTYRNVLSIRHACAFSAPQFLCTAIFPAFVRHKSALSMSSSVRHKSALSMSSSVRHKSPLSIGSSCGL